MHGPDVRYKQRWIAYFDWLGFGDLVKKWPLSVVLSYYEEVLKLVDKDYEVERQATWPRNVHRKWASDTFLFYTDSNSKEDFGDIEAFSRIFFCRATMRQIPLRGSLTLGNFYVNEQDGVFIGPALVDAHDYAEYQEWLGLVLTPSAREYLEWLETQESFPTATYKSCYYAEYQVPYNNQNTPRGVVDQVLVYNLTEFNNGYTNSPNDYYLWQPLCQMCSDAPQKAKHKYANTKEFMLHVCQRLRELVNRNRA